MEIKKKIVETKEKVKNWWEENEDVIFVSAIAGIAAGVSYVIGANIGRSDGIVIGRKRVVSDLLEEFGIQPESDDTTVCIRNCDTGFLDGIVTKEFEKLILSQPSVIHYDDGSWEFENETKA